MNVPEIIVVFLAFGGFLLAFYIYHSKTRGEKLVCPIGTDCDAVVRSDHSKFCGVAVELLGMTYYGLVALSYGIFLGWPQFHTPPFTFVVVGMAGGALLFSARLTLIQFFKLKKHCSWCLLASLIDVAIFGLIIL